MTARILLFWLAFPLLMYFLILLFPYSITGSVSSNIYYFCCSVCVLLMLIMKFYTWFLQIWHLLSQGFSPFLQNNCIMYIQSRFFTLPLTFSLSLLLFSFFPFCTNLTNFIPEGHALKKNEWQLLHIILLSILETEASSFTSSFFFLFFLSAVPSSPYASFSVFFLTSCSHHRH